MPDDDIEWVPSTGILDTLTDRRVTLRRWRADDAEVMHGLITANLDHLRPTMPWIAHEPLAVEARRALLAEWETAFDSRRDFAYLLLDGSEPAGSAGLHTRQGAGVLEIGYWVAAVHTGQGLATAAARLLAEAALELADVSAVEIHHDARNPASGRVAEKAGFAQVSTYAREPEAPADSGVAVRWVRVRD
ncbi:MAG: GNAT family N-acetyltransferase; N-acetyltransferase [Acidimicrobiales bacterium]